MRKEVKFYLFVFFAAILLLFGIYQKNIVVSADTNTNTNTNVQYSTKNYNTNDSTYDPSQSNDTYSWNNNVSTDDNLLMTRSLSNPQSISEFRKIGYYHFQYTRWIKYNVLSTKGRRITKDVILNGIGLLIPYKWVAAGTTAYSIIEDLKTQKHDVWVTGYARNILAKSPRGLQVLIGQQLTLKFYTNSSKTRLARTLNKTIWIN
ncbi:hypothetical protein AKUA1202_04810 [Apilactobacillus kunkeei]|nr:hypothetical protein AKUA1802_04700 [Apilactobacillus kunkeei]CAI2580464.1 hypothetical protein AKUA0901_04700 [Apilactobacillus kunkeei]CAI2580824.1 hypothetical protein AKUA1201_04700 [Apilactobacillus kunkeei]CAI2581122.1 hypothetical protein AKUA1002_04700 [Apilactobacillus kunkeei]CAI2646900.1 hypothetical protein AKUA1803_04700 [Apilactobacillus kunkeei]